MLTNAPKGTKDVMPSQVYRWNYVEEKFKEQCRRYGFKEIRTPVFEHTELFYRGVGETTDIVQKEMYTFKDKGDRSITLKPEGTASVARAFLEHKEFANVQPTKYFYNTACYRYERPQAGRQKEFHQFGVEIFGAKGMVADTEVISLANDFLKDVGINELELRINSVGCPVCREKYKDALRDYFRPHLNTLCDTCKDRFERNPMRIIDCKSPEDKEIASKAPSILEYLCQDCKTSFDELKENLDALEIDYIIDPTIVRGLDYYTKTAFEFVSNSIGSQGTVCGGGRYDNLIEEIGGQDIPGVGFGLGIERLLLLMENIGIDIPSESQMDALIITMGDEAKSAGLKLSKELRNKGLSSQMDPLERNLKGQLKYADRLGYKFALIIGDDELKAESVQARDLKNSNQEIVKFSEIYSWLKERI